MDKRKLSKEKPGITLAEMLTLRSADDGVRLGRLVPGYLTSEEYFEIRGRISKQRIHQLKKEGQIETLRLYGCLWIAAVNLRPRNWRPSDWWSPERKKTGWKQR